MRGRVVFPPPAMTGLALPLRDVTLFEVSLVPDTPANRDHGTRPITALDPPVTRSQSSRASRPRPPTTDGERGDAR